MTIHDRVMEIMSTDPKRNWTAPEITRIIFPEVKRNQWENKRKHVYNTLASAERYGMVRKNGIGKNKLTYWRLIA